MPNLDPFAPLVRFADQHPEIHPSDFMYMGTSSGVSLYKHHRTRHYLNLDNLGLSYTYDPCQRTYFHDLMTTRERVNITIKH